MDFENEVISYLASKDNIKIVWEISERFHKVKEKLHIDFWEYIFQRINNEFGETNEGWKLELEKNKAKIVHNYGGFEIEPNLPDHQSLYLKFSFSQEYNNGSFRLFYGINWNTEFPKEKTTEITISELLDLKNDLIKNGYNINQPHWAIGWKWTDYYAQSRDFCERVAESGEQFAGEIAGIFLEVFNDYKSQVENANKAIATAEKNGNVFP